MRIPDHLTCLLRNCMQVKKQQLELDMEQQAGSKSGKEYIKAGYYHSAYLTYMQSTSCEMPCWLKHKLKSRLPGEISITLDMQMTPPLCCHGCTCVPHPEPPSPYHPSGSSQCTSPKLPVSCIEPGLALCFLYDIIHVLMPSSQIIPPHPKSPKDCSIHLCLFCCLTYRVVITIFLNSIYMR